MQVVTPRGQGLVEYAMIILLVGIAVIITLSIFVRRAPGGSSRGRLSSFAAPSAGVGLSGLGARVSCLTPPHGQLDASR